MLQVPVPFREFKEPLVFAARRRRGKGMRFAWTSETVFFRARRDVPMDAVLSRDLLEVLRPCPPDGLPPSRMSDVIGRAAARNLKAGEHVTWRDLK